MISIIIYMITKVQSKYTSLLTSPMVFNTEETPTYYKWYISVYNMACQGG